MNRKDH